MSVFFKTIMPIFQSSFPFCQGKAIRTLEFSFIEVRPQARCGPIFNLVNLVRRPSPSIHPSISPSTRPPGLSPLPLCLGFARARSFLRLAHSRATERWEKPEATARASRVSHQSRGEEERGGPGPLDIRAGSPHTSFSSSNRDFVEYYKISGGRIYAYSHTKSSDCLQTS